MIDHIQITALFIFQTIFNVYAKTSDWLSQYLLK